MVRRGSKVEHTHDIRLGPNCHEPVDMLADRDQYLAGHVPALLGPRGLILNVDACRAPLDKQLRQFHDCRQSSVPSVGIGDDGPQVVDICNPVTVGLGRRESLFAHFPVVEELCHEQLIDLPGDGVLVLISRRYTAWHGACHISYHGVVC